MKKIPLRFQPYYKSVVWGGDKICKYKGVAQNEPNIGESWEISAVPGHVSVVEEGEYKGESLTNLIDKFGEELLGKKVIEKYGKNFPLLIKFIDASQNLSVQVHPDDKLAKERHNSLGKTEMWYLIETEPGAKIYAGLNEEITPEEYEKRVKEGNFFETIAAHDSNPGDVFYLPAGRVHAIGAGNLLAEIQENSDITYRIYDYDRKDADGNPRELHTTLAKDAIDYQVYDNYVSPAPSIDKDEETLVKCNHFTTTRIIVDGEKSLKSDGSSFLIVICIRGEVIVGGQDGELKISQGDTVLIPASATEISLKGKGELLLAQV